MSLTLRNTKGSALTYAEADANFSGLADLSLTSFLQSGGVARTVQSKERDIVSVFDFMTTAQIADVQSNGFTLDVTAAVQAALTASLRVYFPAGTYLITSTLTVTAGQVLSGSSRGIYASITGSVLRSNTASLVLMQIVKGSTGVLIENLMFWGGNSAYLAGTRAILMQGSSAASDSPINGIRIVNCGFWNWERAILGQDSAAGSFQVSSVHIEDCVLAQNLYGIYMNSTNCDYWLVDNCTGSVAINGSWLYINVGGAVDIRSTTVGGADTTTTAFVTINGASGIVYMERCQAESIKYFLNNITNASNVMLAACIVNGDILITPAGANLLLLMCSITNPVTLQNSDHIVDIMSTWVGSGALTLNSNSFSVAEMGVNKPSNASQTIAKFKGGMSVQRLAISQSSSIGIDSRLSTEFSINVTSNAIFTITNPTVEADTTPRITIQVKNSSGGAMGVITWDTKYKMSAWTNPGNATSRSIDFQYDGTNWIQVSQTGVDVPN